MVEVDINYMVDEEISKRGNQVVVASEPKQPEAGWVVRFWFPAQPGKCCHIYIQIAQRADSRLATGSRSTDNGARVLMAISKQLVTDL
jgi:hypothetical protein